MAIFVGLLIVAATPENYRHVADQRLPSGPANEQVDTLSAEQHRKSKEATTAFAATAIGAFFGCLSSLRYRYCC